MKKFPKIGDRVRVFNPVADRWMEGTCIDHLSTQWVMSVLNDKDEVVYDYVVHPSWRWK